MIIKKIKRMKNQLKFNLLFIMILALISFHSEAQSLVKINNKWNIATYPTFSPNTSTVSLRIGEDTILNDISYNKIYISRDSLNTNWVKGNTYIREDSTKRVFARESISDEILDEVLLYDFSLQVNDTFPVYDGCALTVYEVDSLMLNNGELRKRLKVGVKDQPGLGVEYWIEGIGSNRGLLRPYCYYDINTALLCFYSDSELLYPESPPFCYITDVKEIEKTNIQIFPNPVEEFLNIENEDLILESFMVYDITGKLIKEGSLSGMNNQIHFDRVQSGFYILLLRDKEGDLYSQKLIKE